MYIEFVILDNFLLTYLAGAAATRLAHNRVSVPRTLAAATVGTAVAVFYPFLPSGYGVSLSVKAALYAVLCVIMFYKTQRAAVMSVMFLGCTFAFGGASYAFGAVFFGINGAERFIRKYPLFLTLGCGAAVYWAVKFCLKKTRLSRAREPYEYGTRVSVLGTNMDFQAFLDTGNCVFDDKTGLPVVITDIDCFTQRLDGTAAIGFAKMLPSLRKIRAVTAAGATEIYIVEPTCISVYSDRHEHKINAMIGLISGGGKRFSGSHEMLLSPAVMAEV